MKKSKPKINKNKYIPKYRKGGNSLINDLGNVGAFGVNTVGAVVGGAAGNEDLIPEIEYSGRNKDKFAKAGDQTEGVAGAIGKYGAVAAGAALGVPPSMIMAGQSAVGAATRPMTNEYGAKYDTSNGVQTGQQLGSIANSLGSLIPMSGAPEAEGIDASNGTDIQRYNPELDGQTMYARNGGIMKMYNDGGIYAEGGEGNARLENREMYDIPGGIIGAVNHGSHESEKDALVNIPVGTKMLPDHKGDSGINLKIDRKIINEFPKLFKNKDIGKTFSDASRGLKTSKAENKIIEEGKTSPSIDFKKMLYSKKMEVLEYVKQSKYNQSIERANKKYSMEYNPNQSNQEMMIARNGGVKKYRDAGTVPYKPLNFNQQSNLDFNNPYLNQNSFNLDTENDQKNSSYDPNYNPYQKSLNNFDVTAGNQNTYMDNNTYQPKYNPYGNSLKPFSIDQNNRFMNTGSNPGSYKSTESTDDKNNSKFPTEAFLSGLADNAGNFAYLAGEGKKYDKVNYGAIAPKTIDFSEAIRQGNQDAANSRNNLKNIVGGNAGAYMANISQIQNANTMNKAKIIQEGENINAGIVNQANMFNKQNEIRGMQDEAGNKGQALTNYYKAIEGIGRNTTQAFTDYKKGKMDTNTAKMLSQAFADFGLDINKEGDYVLFYKKLQEQQRLGATSVSSPSRYNPSSTIPSNVNSYKGMNKFKLGQ